MTSTAGGVREAHPDPFRWIEPTRALPLRWGAYADRLGWGLALIVGGGASIAGSNTFQLLALLGTVPHVVGWAILPAQGWRRVLVPLPSAMACWLLLTGPQFLAVLVVPFICWMVVRQRPPLVASVAALLPLAVALAIAFIATDYSPWMLIGLGAMALALVGGALAARGLAASGARIRTRRAAR